MAPLLGYASWQRPFFGTIAFLREVRAALPDADDELRGLLNTMEDHLRRGAPASDLAEALALGGDSDSTGATLGAGGIPAAWLAGLAEWPRSIAWIQRLADRLAQDSQGRWPGLRAVSPSD